MREKKNEGKFVFLTHKFSLSCVKAPTKIFLSFFKKLFLVTIKHKSNCVLIFFSELSKNFQWVFT